MPKHVGLGVSLKNSLHSKEFISLLHKLGHCVSYDDILRIDTTWATNIIESNEGYAMLPSNMVNGLFTQAASDNADYRQENHSQHVTNTVVYQYGQFQMEQPTKVTSTSRSKKLRRYVPIPEVPLEEFRAVAKPVLPP